MEAKVNMSLDDIIKMGKKDKKRNNSAGGSGKRKFRGGGPSTSRNTNNNSFKRRNPRNKGNGNNSNQGAAANNKKQLPIWKKKQQANVRGGGFVKKRYNNASANNNSSNNANKNQGLTRSRSNIRLNRNQKANNNGGAAGFKVNNKRFALNRSRSRNNLNNLLKEKTNLKRTNSMPNLLDPNSIHSRLGYQSPAQIAYRNRVKRAKQLLLQRQTQRINQFNEFRNIGGRAKGLTVQQQQQAQQRRQQILTPQRLFNAGGLRSDQIVRAQKRAQLEQKILRMNAARANTGANVSFLRTMGNTFANARPLPMGLNRSQSGSLTALNRQLPRGRSPFRQAAQALTMQTLQQRPRPRSRSRSRSRSRVRTVPRGQDPRVEVDDRTFSEVMYSISTNLGVTGRTLNDRFSY